MTPFARWVVMVTAATLLGTVADGKALLLQRVKVPADRPGLDPQIAIDTPPHLFFQAGTMFYDDGEKGPIRALDPASLRERWAHPVDYAETQFLAATGDTLYFFNHGIGAGAIVALDLRTRQVKWRVASRDYSRWPAPADRVARIVAGRLVVCGWDTITGFALDSGEVVFTLRYDLENGSDFEVPSGGTADVVWGIDDRVVGLDSRTGTVCWEMNLRLRPPHYAYDGYVGLGNQIVPASDGLALFCFTHKTRDPLIICVDVKTRRVAWQFPCAVDSFARAGDKAFVSGHGAKEKGAGRRGVWCFDLASGKIRWSRDLPGINYTAFGISPRALYFCRTSLDRDDPPSTGYVHAISRETGEPLWSDQLPAPTRRAPVVFGDRIYVLAPASADRVEHSGVIQVYSDAR